MKASNAAAGGRRPVVLSTRKAAGPLAHLTFSDAARELVRVGRQFHTRGWALGTAGNFSAVTNSHPLRLAITATGVDKGSLTASDVLEVDASGAAIGRARGAPGSSAETELHLAIVRERGAGAVLHTHSVWGTALSSEYSVEGGIAIEGYEMLKGLEGVHTHEHAEWIPILKNSQQMSQLARAVEQTLRQYPRTHGFLLEGHGLYTWGRDLAEAPAAPGDS